MEKYENLSNETKELLIEWMELTGEVITALRVDGLEPAESMKLLRNSLWVKKMKYLDR